VFNKVKAHIGRHQVAYSMGTVVVIAGITCFIMRRNIAQGGMSGADAQGGSANTASFIFRNKQTIKVTNVLARDGRGHPGWPVQNLETKKIFFSQKQAAEAFNIPEGNLSGHLQGKFPDVDGLHFERVNLVPV
jgi:hypothetical protein